MQLVTGTVAGSSTIRAGCLPGFAAGFPPAGDAPDLEMREGRYLVRFARTPEEIAAALRCRFEVFNLELGEGLDSAYRTGQDRDAFDEFCHHLVVLDRSAGTVVGTYRMQTGAMAAGGRGFYSAVEFDLSALARGVLPSAVELGRACITREHRNTRVLYLLWRGIAAYCALNKCRYLFGCCSLTSQDPAEGARAMGELRRLNALAPEHWVLPRRGFECAPDCGPEACGNGYPLPRLFRTYLRFGARACSPPAIDRAFRTIDFLVMMDAAAMPLELRLMFFGSGAAPGES